MAFFPSFPNAQKRYYRIDFDRVDLNEYTLRWSTNSDETWDDPPGTYETDPTVGKRDGNEDSIFTEALCFILYHWWDGTFESGDYFLFNADPDYAALEMPVLFYNYGGASAYTTNHVNSLIDGSKVFTGLAHGPEFDYLDKTNSDILMDYAQRLFQKAGYTVKKADSRFYHHFGGDVHCGTNVKRNIPDYRWWEHN